jgi:hypothetical protein
MGCANMPRIFLAAAVLLAGCGFGHAEISKAVRSDILLLLVAAISPVTMSTYCEKRVGRNQALNDAAERFVHRHVPILDKLTTGLGLTPDQVRSGWEVAGKTAMESVMTGTSDPQLFCQRAAAFIDQGKA